MRQRRRGPSSRAQKASKLLHPAGRLATHPSVRVRVRRRRRVQHLFARCGIGLCRRNLHARRDEEERAQLDAPLLRRGRVSQA